MAENKIGKKEKFRQKCILDPIFLFRESAAVLSNPEVQQTKKNIRASHASYLAFLSLFVRD